MRDVNGEAKSSSWAIFVCDKAAERAFRPFNLLGPTTFLFKTESSVFGIEY